MKPMSKYPNEAANINWDDEWDESESPCPICKNVRMWEAGWYDDSEDAGGACIGSQKECGNCGHHQYD